MAGRLTMYIGQRDRARARGRGMARSSRGGTNSTPGVALSVEGVEEVLKNIKKFDEALRMRVMRTAGRRAAKPMIQSYRDEIKNLSDAPFTVYRDGKVYAQVRPGQLRDSIAAMFFKSKKKDMLLTVIGPRVKGAFRNPNKGGWYAHFVNYGYLSDGKYRGENLGFADRARMKAAPAVNAEFKTAFFQEAQKYLNQLRSRGMKV